MFFMFLVQADLDLFFFQKRIKYIVLGGPIEVGLKTEFALALSLLKEMADFRKKFEFLLIASLGQLDYFGVLDSSQQHFFGLIDLSFGVGAEISQRSEEIVVIAEGPSGQTIGGLFCPGLG